MKLTNVEMAEALDEVWSLLVRDVAEATSEQSRKLRHLPLVAVDQLREMSGAIAQGSPNQRVACDELRQQED